MQAKKTGGFRGLHPPCRAFAFGRGLSAALIVAGGVVLYCSQPLMFWLIWLVGEERALGVRNVVRDGDRILLTNPGAMFLWTLPFLAGGFVLVCCGIWLLWRNSSGQHRERS